MPSYKLTYFEVRGETACCLFALAGVPYEDNRVDFTQWADMKASKY